MDFRSVAYPKRGMAPHDSCKGSTVTLLGRWPDETMRMLVGRGTS
jgi:hypothetical protein